LDERIYQLIVPLFVDRKKMIVRHPAGLINTSSWRLKVTLIPPSLTKFPASGFRFRYYMVPVIAPPFLCNPDAIDIDEGPDDAGDEYHSPRRGAPRCESVNEYSKKHPLSRHASERP